MLACPSGIVERPLFPFEGPTGRYPYGYSINTHFTGDGAAPRWGTGGTDYCKLDRIYHPANKLLAVEEDSYYINDGAWRAFNGEMFAPAVETGIIENRLSIRHDSKQEYSKGEADGPYRRCNVALSDGHAGTMSRLDTESSKSTNLSTQSGNESTQPRGRGFDQGLLCLAGEPLFIYCTASRGGDHFQ